MGQEGGCDRRAAQSNRAPKTEILTLQHTISWPYGYPLQPFAVVAGATGAGEAKDGAAGSQEAAPEGASGKLDDGLVYESYDPLRLQQNEGRELLPFPTFDAALDEFYAKVKAHGSPGIVVL